MTQITGAPIWVRTDKYDLAAVADSEGQHTETFWRSTLQMYIAESFQLTFHRETGELPFYVLTVSNTDPRLNGSDGDPNGLPELSVTLGSKNPATANLAVISAKNASLEDLAGVLQRVVLEWPVIDHTGIAGRYDFILRWTPDGSQFGDAPNRIPTATNGNAPPDLLTTLEKQVGLKLDILYAPTEVLVIDSVEKPSGYWPGRPDSYRASRSTGALPTTTGRPSPFSTDLNPDLVTNNLY